MLKKFCILISIILGLFISGLGAPKLALDFTHYYRFEELTAALQQLAAAHPKLLKLESIGKSFQGRDLWAVTINNPETGAEHEKPGMYIDANIHGNELQGAEVCLYTIWYLMEYYQENQQITELVDRRVFYILPSVNPDGRTQWFEGPNTPHSSRSGLKPIDEDRDWLFDEDDYDDLDGDGEILQMRTKDPAGKFRLAPTDPRIRIYVEKDEKGEFTFIGTEGIDNDGDGLINEDAPGGYDANRNWPSMWRPEYIQGGAGDYPLSLPESEAVAQFILSRPNIAGVQAFHNSGGMILRGPGTQDFGEYPGRDVSVYDQIGAKGEKILPHYRYLVIHKDLYSVYGGFITWTFEDLGIFSFTNELFSSDQYVAAAEKKPRNSSADDQKDRLLFNDLVEFGEMFVDWKPFNHPTYGAIEIGGWKKYASRINPTFMLPELCHRNCAFTLFHARQLPQPQMTDLKISKLAPGIYRIRVGVTNESLIPTISGQARLHQLHRPDLLTITGKGIQVISAGKVENQWSNKISRIKTRPERLVLPDGLWFNDIEYYEWLVSGSGTAVLKLDCLKGGVISQNFSLE
jgi:hypothetical protein